MRVRGRRLLVWTALSLAQASVACEGNWLLSAERRADTDASVDDAGIGSSDGARRAVDAATPPQVGVGDFTGGWVHAPWAGSCPLYQPATDAQLAAVPNIHWSACPEGNPQCLALVPDWPVEDVYHQLIQLSMRASSETSVEIMFSRDYSVHRHEVVIWDSALGMEAAWRYDGDDNDCLIALGDIEAGKDALTITMEDGKTFPEYRQIFGTAVELRAKTTPDYDFSPTDIGFGDALWMDFCSASSSLATMGASDSLFVVRDRGSSDVQLYFGDEVFPFDKLVEGAELHTTNGGAFVFTEARGEQLVRASGATTVHDFTGDVSALIWLESSGNDGNGFFTKTTLFTSPFATSAGELAPSALFDVPCNSIVCGTSVSQGFANIGVVATPPFQSSQLLVRLSDHVSWELDSSGRRGLGRVLNGEIWIPSTDFGGDSIERIALSALGPPTNH